MTEVCTAAPVVPVLEQHRTGGSGVSIAYDVWPRPGATPVVLVHGTSAHSGWWHHIAPALSERYDIAALDFSGHGDSGRRASYSLAAWGSDVLAVIEARWPGQPVFVVGHSVGGLVAATAARLNPAAVQALLLVDCIVGPTPAAPMRTSPLRPPRVFRSVEEAVAGFRLTPPQDADPDLLRAVAESSLRRVEGGWSWKVDMAIFDVVADPELYRAVDGITCDLAIVRGEHSALVGPDAGVALGRRLDRPIRQWEVAGAGHHLMLDRPAAFSHVLRQALDELVTTALDSSERGTADV